MAYAVKARSILGGEPRGHPEFCDLKDHYRVKYGRQ